jgi:hypothetical protein
VLETIPFEGNSEDFAFDAEMLAQASHHGFALGDAPIPVRYFPEASSIDFWNSSIYGLKTLRALFLFLVQRSGLKRVPLFDRASRPAIASERRVAG